MALKESNGSTVAQAVIGVDVASKHLDAAVHGGAGIKRLNNTPAAIGKWLDCLPAGTVIAVESTSRYHQALVQLAHARGFVVYLLNPRDVRHYARGLGMRGKTDTLDAKVLARYAAHEGSELRAWQPLSAEQSLLEELIRRRGVLVKHQAAIAQSLADCPALRTASAALMREFDKLLSELDTQIAQACADITLDSGAFERITSVPGIGLLSGAALLTLFQRLASRGADAVIAFLGLDPRPMDSGQKNRCTPPVQARPRGVATLAVQCSQIGL
jgi:transposase